MTFLRVSLAAAAALACFGLINPASATAIGNLNVSNCASGSLSWSATNITWSPAGTIGGTGCIDTAAGTNVTYSGGPLAVGTAGNILNLTLGGGVEDNFMGFAGTTLDFVLTGLGPGSGNTVCSGLGVGSECSVGSGNPFILTNEGGGVTDVSLTAFGTILDGGVTDNWSVTFDSDTNLTAEEIQSVIEGSGTISNSYLGMGSVSNSASTPEPSTVFMMMMISVAGLLLVGRNSAISYSFGKWIRDALR